MKPGAAYGEIELGVECALPAAFSPRRETSHLSRTLARLVRAILRPGRRLVERAAAAAQPR